MLDGRELIRVVAIRPGDARADDLALLADAGLTTPQIIALSELLGFLAFEIRVVAGLSLLEAAT